MLIMVSGNCESLIRSDEFHSCLLLYYKKEYGMLQYIIKIILSAFVFLLSWWIGTAFHTTYYYTVMFICPFTAIYAFIQILHILGKLRIFQRLLFVIAPYIQPLKQKLKSFLSRSTNFFLHMAHRTIIYQKFEYLHLKNTSRITGYRDEYMHRTDVCSSPEYEALPLKWHKCRTNAHKVRFLYLKYVLANKKSGKPFSYADTPNQLQKKWAFKDAKDNLLTSSYYYARYKFCDGNEESRKNEDIADEVIEKLKS